MDIDHFKSINDTQGHIEGDRALRIFANVLQSTTDAYRGASGRLGGDEFIAVVEQKHMESPDDFGRELNEKIGKEEATMHLPYTLRASVGYARCDSSYARTTDLISVADKEMYANKQAKRTV